jgi:hypothetical protein
MRRLGMLAALLIVAGCGPTEVQGPDVVAVSQSSWTRHVVGRGFRSPLVLLVDRSAQMGAPLEPSNPACTAGCGANSPCPADCPTRLDETRRGLSAFLQRWGLEERMGLTAFPADEACTPPSTELVRPLSLEREADRHSLARSVVAINRQLDALTPAGGVPIAEALRFVGTLPSMHEPNVDHFVLLVTGGGPACAQSTCVDGCVDVDATVTAIQELERSGIHTLLVGVGAGGERAAVLSAIGNGSPYPRRCVTDAACGPGDRCLADYRCGRPYLLLDELLPLLEDAIGTEDPCTFPLQTLPARPEYLFIWLDGQLAAPGPDTWSLSMQTGLVRIEGAACAAMMDSTVLDPYEIAVKVIEVL